MSVNTAVVLPLVSTLTKNTLNGSEGVATVYLAVFSIGIAAGSALASWLASGRIILIPSPIGAVTMGIFMLDLASVTLNTVTPATELGVGAFFGVGPGIHVGIDLLGIAISGGLIIVPAFAAVQAWAAAAERARIIGAVNITSAGAIVAGAVSVALLQMAGVTAPQLFLLLAAASFVVGILFFRFLPTNPLTDLLSIVFRAFYRLEVKGAENLTKGSANPIIALNHVNFLDAALALSLLDQEPVFAIDYGISQLWWVRPLLKFTRAMPLDPTKPMAVRTLINAVKGGDPLVIFPEGRLTVTGSLMKVYDGAGLVADKCDSTIIPVHPADPRAGAPPFPAESHRHRPRAGQAFGGARAEGQASAPGARSRALSDHVRSRLPHHPDRSDDHCGAHGGGRPAWSGQDRRRRSDRRPPLLPPAPRRRAPDRWKADALGGGGPGDRRNASQYERRRGDDRRADLGRPRSRHDQLQQRQREHRMRDHGPGNAADDLHRDV